MEWTARGSKRPFRCCLARQSHTSLNAIHCGVLNYQSRRPKPEANRGDRIRLCEHVVIGEPPLCPVLSYTLMNLCAITRNAARPLVWVGGVDASLRALRSPPARVRVLARGHVDGPPDEGRHARETAQRQPLRIG